MKVDYIGKRFSGAEVLSCSQHARGVRWEVRCACGAHFAVSSDRLRLAQAYMDGRRKTPAHVRCGRCTERARARAIQRRGGFSAMRSAS